MTREIPLTRGAVALVDDEDYERVACHRWYCEPHGYAARKDGDRKVYMHRFVFDDPSVAQVDHINGDRLDNRRANLRAASSANNQRNRKKIYREQTSRFKGISFHPRTGTWFAYITVEGKRHSLGYHHDEIRAARIYDRAALHFFGEFARLNFPDDVETTLAIPLVIKKSLGRWRVADR